VLSPRIINKTLTRLSQVLSLAVEYELIPANPPEGRRRRLNVTRTRRPFVEPVQLMALLAAADEKPTLYGGKGRVMLAVQAVRACGSARRSRFGAGRSTSSGTPDSRGVEDGCGRPGRRLASGAARRAGPLP